MYRIFGFAALTGGAAREPAIRTASSRRTIATRKVDLSSRKKPD